MPREVFGAGFVFLHRSQILTYEEISRLVRLGVGLGIEKVRITGGEPLLRTDLVKLIEMLAVHEGLDLALTTNGLLLPRMAADLAAAGLGRVTVSLDSLDDGVFRRMNDAGASVDEVLRGIAAAARAGLAPIKINAVVIRGVNDHTLVDLARHFRGTGHVVRFIEYMDVGHSNGWRLDQVVSGSEIVERLAEVGPLEPVAGDRPGEVADRWRWADGAGEIGVITSVSRPFCGACTRGRLSAEGKLYTCLFASRGLDLRTPLRSGADDDELTGILASAWRARHDRYSEQRSAETGDLERVEMSYIGG
jgi:cyclic pyranopterin phosphate synthase